MAGEVPEVWLAPAAGLVQRDSAGAIAALDPEGFQYFWVSDPRNETIPDGCLSLPQLQQEYKSRTAALLVLATADNVAPPITRSLAAHDFIQRNLRQNALAHYQLGAQTLMNHHTAGIVRDVQTHGYAPKVFAIAMEHLNLIALDGLTESDLWRFAGIAAGGLPDRELVDGMLLSAKHAKVDLARAGRREFAARLSTDRLARNLSPDASRIVTAAQGLAVLAGDGWGVQQGLRRGARHAAAARPGRRRRFGLRRASSGDDPSASGGIPR